jgi:hypothetical protein
MPGEEGATLIGLAPRPEDSALIFVFGEGGTLYRSLDGGAEWAAVLTAAPGPAQFESARGANGKLMLFFLTRQALYLSTDEGASWTDIGFSGATAIVVAPDYATSGLVYAGTVDGLIVEATAGP